MLAPQILCLQESFTAQGYDTSAMLAKKLKLNRVHFPARFKQRLVHGSRTMSGSGLAVLGAYPIAGATTYPLPSVTGDDRWLQQVDFQLEGSVVSVFNTHLTHLPDPQQRAEQLRIVMARIDQHGVSTSLLCGDLNMTPDDRDLSPVLDCPRRVVPRVESRTPTTFGSNPRRLDYAVAFQGEEQWQAACEFTALQAIDPIAGVRASDHAAVVLDLELIPS